MSPYTFAITTLEHQAEISEQNAPIHEAEGNHAQGALGRMTAASCRAAIAVLQAAPADNKPRAYTWLDVESYSQRSNHTENTATYFLTMRDGQQLQCTVPAMDTSDAEQAAVIAAVNAKAGSAS
jgi:hypothetical protein